MNSIFISGASKGIGLAIARRFHAEGWKVGISARGEEALAQAAAEMPGLITWQADMANKESVQALALAVAREMGPLSILVNNAGIYLPGEMHTEADEDFENLMATNVFSAYYLTKGLVPAMKEQKKGSIFNLGSIASVMPYGGTYAVTKHALLGFSRVLREELKPHGVRVVCLMPGAVRTASWEGTDLPEERFMPAEDMASLVWDVHHLSPRTVVEELIVRPQLGDI